MNRHVPSPPEGVDVVSVPPVAVEVPIGEVEQLAHEVEVRVKRQIEKAQPHEVVRYLEANEAQLQKYPADTARDNAGQLRAITAMIAAGARGPVSRRAIRS